MKNTGAIVWWIDRNCSLQSAIIAPHALKGGATYRSEAIWITDNAEHFEVFMIDRANGVFEQESLERLRLKADQMRIQQEERNDERAG